MALNLSDFANANRQPAPAQGGRRRKADGTEYEEAKIWINFGYIKRFKNEQDEDDQVFVTIARGIPVDQIEPFDLDRIRNSNMATLRRDQNRFLAAIMGEADKLEPGQSKIIAFDNDRNLGIELRRVGDAAPPHEEDASAPLPFSFG